MTFDEMWQCLRTAPLRISWLFRDDPTGYAKYKAKLRELEFRWHLHQMRSTKL